MNSFLDATRDSQEVSGTWAIVKNKSFFDKLAKEYLEKTIVEDTIMKDANEDEEEKKQSSSFNNFWVKIYIYF